MRLGKEKCVFSLFQFENWWTLLPLKCPLLLLHAIMILADLHSRQISQQNNWLKSNRNKEVRGPNLASTQFSRLTCFDNNDWKLCCIFELMVFWVFLFLSLRESWKKLSQMDFNIHWNETEPILVQYCLYWWLWDIV